MDDAFLAKIIGSPILPAIHGGMTGAFLETAAIVGVTREPGAAAPPKPIGLTIGLLCGPAARSTAAPTCSIVKQGRRIVAFVPRGEEFVKKAALLRASARLKYVVPYDLDKNEKLDPMALLEEVMRHFYRKAKIEQSLHVIAIFGL